ncbi:hypothetical protein [Stomatobaculum longum]|uniref:hypothetical protein n=1 Tax=Stomatobaculum longum TaxID=796942 RepID=UPI0028E6545E|nr:hypothetical protein [Stomatobaculum longum]
MKRKVDLAKNVMWHVSAVLACALLKDEESARVFTLARQGKPKNGAYGREPKKDARTQEIQKNISKKMLQCSNQSEALASYSIEKQNGGSLHDGTGVTRAL